MKSRIILVGRAASGKDFLKNKFESKGFKREISYTTRPARENEVNGRDYWFINEQTFIDCHLAGDFYEAQNFNGWWYGTTNAQFSEKDLFIMTPGGVNDIKPEDRGSCFIIYLDIPEDIRRKRLSLRGDADKVERRILADEIDFKNFTDYDMRITNPNF